MLNRFLFKSKTKLTKETLNLKIKNESQYSGITKMSLKNQTKLRAIPTQQAMM